MRLVLIGLAVLLIPAAAMAMDAAVFAKDLATAERTDLSRAQREFAYDGLLRRRDLDPVQKSEVYRLRGVFRVASGGNLKDAIKDYQSAAGLNPGNAKIAPALAYAEQLAAEAEGRLKTGAQLNSAKADDLYALGRTREAYAIWKEMTLIGLYPSQNVIDRLVEDRVFCALRPRGKMAIPAESSYGHGDLAVCTL